MDDISFNGPTDCRLSNVALQHGNSKLADCSFNSPFPQWPPKDQTATTLIPYSTISRISSVLPRSSDGASTFTASVKTLQSPSAAASDASPTSNTSVAPKAVTVTRVSPSTTRYLTATLISVTLSTSNTISNTLPAITDSPTLVTAAPATSNSATTSSSIGSEDSSDPQLSSIFSSDLMTISGSTAIAKPTAQAAAQQTPDTEAIAFGDTKMSSFLDTKTVIGLVVGIILGVFLIVLPAIYYVYRRRTRKQAHRRSIGAIEADKMFRPWKKAETDLIRRRSNMASLYYPSEKGAELAMPPPVFAPLRPNRSSSLYSGSMLAGLEHLTPQETRQSMAFSSVRYSFDNESMEGESFDEKRSSSRFSGYIYSDNPFEAPLIAPEMHRPKSVVIVRKLPREYTGKIKFGMGVQRS